jgi:nitroreductase
MSDDDRSKLIHRSEELLGVLKKRRSVRSFADAAIPIEVVENCIAIAASAPSGANSQPWTFVLVEDPATKRTIRKQAEAVERSFYETRISDEWREKLKPLGTDAQKPFLEQASFLICIFVQRHGFDRAGKRIKHYYPMESVGIATGFLIFSLHLLGISTLTYTPAPMDFLGDLLQRPKHEKPYMILAVGYPSEDYEPPELERKQENEYLTVL